MKIIKQLFILVILFALGELISFAIRDIIMIPGSIIGMILFFIALTTGLIKVQMIDECATFFANNMSLFVLPAVASFVRYGEMLAKHWFAIIVCGFATGIISMTIIMKLVDIMIESKKKKEANK